VGVCRWVAPPSALPRSLLVMKPKVCPPGPPVALRASTVAVRLAVGGLALPAPGAAATPLGLWYAEGGAAQVAIEPCGRALCGRVVWLRSPLDEEGCTLRDRNNPDPSLRHRPLEGLEILRGLTGRPDGTWADGEVYDPTTGNTYSCRGTLDGEKRLRLRGYVGVPLLGRTATWFRVGTRQVCRDDLDSMPK